MLSKLKKLFGASGTPAPAKADAPREAARIEALTLDAMEALWKLLPEQRGAP